MQASSFGQETPLHFPVLAIGIYIGLKLFEAASVYRTYQFEKPCYFFTQTRTQQHVVNKQEHKTYHAWKAPIQ